LLAERGVEVDHVAAYRWVQRFTPLLAEAARFVRHIPGDRWFVEETYVKVSDVRRYVTEGSTSTDRSSTYWPRPAVTASPPAGSSDGHWPPESETVRSRHRQGTGLPARSR